MSMNNKAADPILNFEDINLAYQRIFGKIRTTPVLSDPVLNAKLGCELWLKCENLQYTGAFKFRGASNAIAWLDEAGPKGDVATHSSGNHGAATVVAAILASPESFSGCKVGAVVSGGNVDLEHLPLTT